MGKLISLVDRLKAKEEEIYYRDGKFPIFEGKVISVSGEIIQNEGVYSIVNYLPKGKESSGPDLGLIFRGRTEECEEMLKKIIRKVLVPFSVNPVIFNGANVQGHITQISEIESYVLEVLEDKSLSDLTKIFGTAMDSDSKFKYEGFKYIVPLNGKTFGDKR